MAKAKNRHSHISGVLVFRAGFVFGGPLSVGPDDIGSDHMYGYGKWVGNSSTVTLLENVAVHSSFEISIAHNIRKKKHTCDLFFGSDREICNFGREIWVPDREIFLRQKNIQF